MNLVFIFYFMCFGNCMAQVAAGTTIPFELQEGRPFVHARINGIPLSLLLDLGGYETVALTKSDTEMVAASKVESTRTFRSSDGNMHSAIGLRLDSLELDAVNFGAVTGSEMAGGGTSYIGAGLLGKKLLVFDYVRNQLRMYESGDKDAFHRECGSSEFPVDIVGGVFQSYLLIDGKVLTAAWDKIGRAHV